MRPGFPPTSAEATGQGPSGPERGPDVYPRAVKTLRTLLDRALVALGKVGRDEADDEDTRLRKSLLLLIAVLVLPISLMWSALYLTFGGPVGLTAFAVLRHLRCVDRDLSPGPATSTSCCGSSSSTSCSRRRCR